MESQEYYKKQFKDYINLALDSYLKYTTLKGNNNDIVLFQWFIDVPSYPVQQPFGVSVGDIIFDKHIEFLKFLNVNIDNNGTTQNV